MCSAENNYKIDRLKKFAPVLFPVVLIMAMTATLRMGTMVQSSFAESSHPYKSKLTQEQFNSTETIFLEYATIFQALTQKNDATVLASLKAIQGAPISADGNTFRSKKIRSFSPASLLMGLSHALANRATELKKSGDDATAREYVRAMYAIADSMLSSRTPTLQGLELVHHFHGLASWTEAKLYPQDTLVNFVTANYQHNALQMMWERQIRPQLGDKPSESNPSANERLVAARLTQEYRDCWSRIRAGEA